MQLDGVESTMMRLHSPDIRGLAMRASVKHSEVVVSSIKHLQGRPQQASRLSEQSATTLEIDIVGE